MEFRVIIPSRYGSKRLKGKPLLDICGKPMIQHVYEKAIQSGAASVVIATDDERIAKAAESFKAPVCMTSTDHNSGTERLAEAVVALGYDEQDVVVNLQGDEPLIPPAVIRQVAENLKKLENARVATLCEKIKSIDELYNTKNVKVALNHRNFALYFSRAPIPWERDNFTFTDARPEKMLGNHYRHVGIYAYRATFLEQYLEWASSPLEKLEQLEQLRVLYHGGRVHVDVAKEPVPIDVNTEADLEEVRAILKA